jgi:hypothetical protein
VSRTCPAVIEPPHLIGGQTEFAEHRPERLAAVDRIQELLAHLGRESLLRLAPEACPRGVVLRLAGIECSYIPHSTASWCRGLPAGHAVGLGIGKLADLVQLLQRPRRSGNQPKGEPSPDNRRRHTAHSSRLANRGDLL